MPPMVLSAASGCSRSASRLRIETTPEAVGGYLDGTLQPVSEPAED